MSSNTWCDTVTVCEAINGDPAVAVVGSNKIQLEGGPCESKIS